MMMFVAIIIIFIIITGLSKSALYQAHSPSQMKTCYGYMLTTSIAKTEQLITEDREKWNRLSSEKCFEVRFTWLFLSSHFSRISMYYLINSVLCSGRSPTAGQAISGPCDGVRAVRYHDVWICQYCWGHHRSTRRNGREWWFVSRQQIGLFLVNDDGWIERLLLKMEVGALGISGDNCDYGEWDVDVNKMKESVLMSKQLILSRV